MSGGSRPRDAKWLRKGDLVEIHRDRYRTVARIETHYPVNSKPFTVIYWTDGTDQSVPADTTLYAWRKHQ